MSCFASLFPILCFRLRLCLSAMWHLPARRKSLWCFRLAGWRLERVCRTQMTSLERVIISEGVCTESILPQRRLKRLKQLTPVISSGATGKADEFLWPESLILAGVLSEIDNERPIN